MTLRLARLEHGGSDDSLSCRENVTEHGSSSSKAAARTHSPCLWLTWGTLRAPPLLCSAPRSLSPAAGLSQMWAWVRQNSLLMIPKRKTSTGVAAEHRGIRKRQQHECLCNCNSAPLCVWDVSAYCFFHRRISHLFCTDILDNALIPVVLLEWQVLNSPHYAWSCAPNVQNMVKITSVPKLLVWVPQISESGCALVGTYPGPGTCLFSRGK